MEKLPIPKIKTEHLKGTIPTPYFHESVRPGFREGIKLNINIKNKEEYGGHKRDVREQR